jgi:hypothetical protein
MSRLVVHYFKQYSPSQEELFLSGRLLLIKVYALVAGIEVDFVHERYPWMAPMAFVDNSELEFEEVVLLLKETRMVGKSDCDAMEVWIRSELEDILDYALFGNSLCFEKFTKSVYFASTPRPQADIYLFQKRLKWRYADEKEMIAKFNLFNQQVSEIIHKFSNQPSYLDIVLYSFLSPLFAIPPDLAFWEQQNLTHIRAFLLDFDDWLWFHAARPSVISAFVPTLPPCLRDDAVTESPEEDEGPEQVDQTFRSSLHKTQNLIFGTSCLALASVAFVLRRSS